MVQGRKGNWSCDGVASGQSDTLLPHAGAIPGRGLGVCVCRWWWQQAESVCVFGEWLFDEGVGSKWGPGVVFGLVSCGVMGLALGFWLLAGNSTGVGAGWHWFLGWRLGWGPSTRLVFLVAGFQGWVGRLGWFNSHEKRHGEVQHGKHGLRG